MSTLKINYRFVFRFCVLLFLSIFIWYFPSVVIYVFLAFIFSLLGKPLANIIYKIHIFKKRIPYWVCAAIATVAFVLFSILLIVVFIPSLVEEVRTIGNINYDALSAYLSNTLHNVQRFLYNNNLMSANDSIVGIVTKRLQSIMNIEVIANVIGNVVDKTGSFFLGYFTIVFLMFFFIKDDIQLSKVVRVFVSRGYVDKINIVGEKVDNLLTRYFAGSGIRIIIMIILTYIGLAAFGIKAAVFLSLLGGILNIIPYLGPILGAVIACLFGFIDCVSTEMYSEIMPTMIKIIIVFVGSNVVDNAFLQPYIFSQSVKIHPVEVYLVTIVAGMISGMGGMILAIPIYTIFRITVIEIYKYINAENNIEIVSESSMEELREELKEEEEKHHNGGSGLIL